MRSVIFALVTMTTAVSATSAPKALTRPQSASSDPRIELARQRIIDLLKDPESARFKEVYVARDGVSICGAVNSKNSMGGYVGFQRFIIDENDSLFFDDSGPSFPGLIDMACRK